MFTLSLVICVLGLIPQTSNAQWASASMTTYPKRVKNIKSIDLLKKGVLVIRLESKHNNIEKITESLNSGELEPRVKKQLQIQKTQLIEDRDKFNTDIMSAFARYYKFSDYVFMMDTSSVHLLDGVTEGIFLDNSGNIDPTISIIDKNPFIMRIGKLSSETTTGIEALIISDGELNDMQRPFPYYISLNHRLKLKGLFSRTGSLRRSGEDIVKEIEKKFKAFHNYYSKLDYLNQDTGQ